MQTETVFTTDYILLLDLDIEIGKGDPFLTDKGEIGDVAWTTNNKTKILAYSKLNSEASDLKLPLLLEWYDGIDVEKLAKNRYPIRIYDGYTNEDENKEPRDIWIDGFKTAQGLSNDKQFTLKDIQKAINLARTGYGYDGNIDIVEHVDGGGIDNYNNEFKFLSEENIIRQLQQSKSPKKFEPEYEDDITNGWSDVLRGGDGRRKLKMIDTPNGKRVFGKWIY